MAKTTNNTTGLLPGYETTLITKSEMTEDALKKLQERIASVIKSYQGEVVLTEDWGRRRMAYPIQKESRGHYTYYVYTAKGEVVKEIERNLRLNDKVLRFLTVNLDKEFDADAFRQGRAEMLARQNESAEQNS